MLMKAEYLTVVTTCPMCGADSDGHIDDVPEIGIMMRRYWRFLRCSRCRSLWLDPRPNESVLSIIYPSDYVTHFEGQAEPPDGLIRSWRRALKVRLRAKAYGYEVQDDSHRIGDRLVQMLARIPAVGRAAGYSVRFVPKVVGGRLLEVGCGNGSWLSEMSKLGWEVEGIEPDPAAAALARRRGVRVHQLPFDAFDADEGAFDAIVAHHVLEHLAAPRHAILRLAKWLTPGGRFVSFSPNPESVSLRTYGRFWRQLDAPRHFVLPSAESLLSAARHAGLVATVRSDLKTYRWHRRMSHELAGGEHIPSRPLEIMCDLAAHLYCIADPRAGEDTVLMAIKPPDTSA